MPKITFHINMDSINDAIQKVESYQKKVEKLGENTVKRMAEYGSETAKDYATYMDAYDTGWLVGSIHPEFSENKGFVLATAPHSAFVEFGTGLRGSRDQHPEAFVHGWNYDVNHHGEAGWYFIGRDGKLYKTTGMPSRPFMYDTAKTLREQEIEIVKNLLKDNE